MYKKMILTNVPIARSCTAPSVPQLASHLPWGDNCSLPPGSWWDSNSASGNSSLGFPYNVMLQFCESFCSFIIIFWCLKIFFSWKSKFIFFSFDNIENNLLLKHKHVIYKCICYINLNSNLKLTKTCNTNIYYYVILFALSIQPETYAYSAN